MTAKTEIEAENAYHIKVLAFLFPSILPICWKAKFSTYVLIKPVFTLSNTNIWVKVDI